MMPGLITFQVRQQCFNSCGVPVKRDSAFLKASHESDEQRYSSSQARNLMHQYLFHLAFDRECFGPPQSMTVRPPWALPEIVSLQISTIS